MKKIILLEDEKLAGESLKEMLEIKGFHCTHYEYVEDLVFAPKEDIDIFILDYHMHGSAQGLNVAKAIRQAGNKSPIIMLTSETDEKIVVDCFQEAEVDDYLTKPIRIDELKARIDRLMVKSNKVEVNTLKHNSLLINIEKKAVFVEDKEIKLTPSEYKILFFLLQNRGRVVARNELIHYMNDEQLAIGSRCVDTHVNALRNKISSQVVKIAARRGFGYEVL